ncbi:membrane-associated guanylate kinase, WW and PDZ domain-containing protein 3 isoform X2 [Corythoichthys intestinalis]|uniref:membrane-associated guanylate kinase, WW and PDZ domain-containing protein 3 isoform X2 n=1 Tax=Corythoichthys intestinalis TaxID=161448 RepID=UPI0025A4EB46|nr:membrane-associated guanylate kinase, WW and PDZ domain-containing protein 3 isoform X2 [Corythoichthys intestinalis]
MYIDAFKRILFERLNCLKRMCVCQRHGSSLPMSKTVGRKQHWRSRTQDAWLPSVGEAGLAIGGGADYGEFPFVTAAPPDGPAVGDVILEIGGTPVLGMTLGDVRGVLNSCPRPVRIKTVAPGATLCKDLGLYLSKCFTPGSVDSQLQQVIRQNLHLRAVPCTTRAPRAGEISGTDYNFLSVEEFFSLEESGALLESGKFQGNYYGTPRPVHVSAESPPVTYEEHRDLLRNFRTRSKSLSNLEKEHLHGGQGSPRGRQASSGVPENGSLANGGSLMAEDWDQAFSDPGVEPTYFPEHKSSSWQSPGRESLFKNQWLSQYPDELGGFLVRAHLIKGSGGFGFNIVGGSKPGEFLQVYSVTASGPPALKTADILVYVDGVCVLGASHKKVVEMLKSVPVGHAVEIHVRRGHPMLYDPEGRLRGPPATTQPEPLGRPTGDGVTADGYAASLGRSSLSGCSPPRSFRSLARLRSLDHAAASQSDSEVVSAIGSHRASLIRNHNNNSISTPRHPFRFGASLKSSESDLSTCTLPVSHLPLPRSPERPSSSPGGARPRLWGPRPSRFRPLATLSSSPGELVPVALAGGGLGFSVTGGGPGGAAAVVGRIWDRKRCNALQPGDAIVKINGADVKSLSLAQVQAVLQEHTKLGEVILLVYRGGIYQSGFRRPPPPLHDGAVLDNGRTASSPGSSLIQSTSFLESVPVTLTMEPKDWMGTGPEDAVSRRPELVEEQRSPPLRGFHVELTRKPGEGFGFVIASQDLENTKAASLLPHRFVTVRRGSPAAKSGQIRPGDRLEAVEGRSVVTLPHRELAQILRRAGNTLRLTIVPRPSTYSSGLTESAENELGRRSGKAQRWRPKRDSRYYSINLDRGPSGFGFSLRGGSEYNMGLYVLGLMEGGPASRSQKIQVSDQLVEINGDSTAGMSHAQAVEQIRRGGRRVHLVLKRGNGYVPDYDRESRIASPSRRRHPKEQSLAAVDAGRQRGRHSRKKKRGESSDGRGKKTGQGRRPKNAKKKAARKKEERKEETPKEEEKEEEVVWESTNGKEETLLPVPSRDKNLEESVREAEHSGDVAEGYREMKRLGDGDSNEDRSGDKKEPFAFLASDFSGEEESESEGGPSDDDTSAASVYGFSAPANGRGGVPVPGPWLRPKHCRTDR